jgi:hypothetical protein
VNRWIKVDADLISKPKFIAICDAIEGSPVMVAGGLVTLWAWLHNYGASTILSADRIERQLGLPKGLIGAMASVGWAEPKEPSGWIFRLAGPTMPEISEARSRAGRMGNESRWQGDRKAIAGPSQKKKKKRQEEERESPEGDSSPDGPEASSGSPRPENGSKGSESDPGGQKPRRAGAILWTEAGFSGIEPGAMDAWRAAAPACEIEIEIARAHAWMLGQPAQKRKRNLRAFLTSWMLRAQERSAKGGGPRPGPAQSIPRGCRMDSSGVIRTPSGAPLRFEDGEP